jgi:hypothetical protein
MLRGSSLTRRAGHALARSPNYRLTAAGGVHATSFEIEAKLRNDIKHLGKTLGYTIKDHDEKAYDMVEDLRKLGREVSIK